MRSHMINISGNKFNNWFVIEYAYSKNCRTYWSCVCHCGNKRIVRGDHLRKGRSNSCGCLQKEAVSTHKMSKSREFKIWQNMIYRCHNENSKDFKNYGSKGVSVCDRWRLSFTKFYNDMGESPTSQHSIDRINPFGNYEPNNCRWATPKQQANNRRNNHLGDKCEK